MSPIRIQRHRLKGWRAPAGARYVGRGARYGNPNQVVRTNTGWAVNHDHGAGVGTFPSPGEAQRFAVDAYRVHINANPQLVERARTELRGRDLMCWCSLDLPCHADVLLAIANEAVTS